MLGRHCPWPCMIDSTSCTCGYFYEFSQTRDKFCAGLVTLRLDQDLVNVVSVEGENKRSLVTLRGPHAHRRTHDV